jgi:hypothetical protein
MELIIMQWPGLGWKNTLIGWRAMHCQHYASAWIGVRFETNLKATIMMHSYIYACLSAFLMHEFRPNDKYY